MEVLRRCKRPHRTADVVRIRMGDAVPGCGSKLERGMCALWALPYSQSLFVIMS